MMNVIALSGWLNCSLVLVGVLVLGVSASGCTGSSDPESLGDKANPEEILYLLGQAKWRYLQEAH